MDPMTFMWTEFERTLGMDADAAPDTMPEYAADFGGDPTRFSSDWRSRIRAAFQYQQPWMENAKAAWKRYRNRRNYSVDGHPVDDGGLPTFNLFYSTMETIKPLIYQLPPSPIVRRRIRQRSENPNVRAAAETMQRCLQYLIDSSDCRFHEVMLRARDSGLIAGRGIVEVDYVPLFDEPPVKPTPVHYDDQAGRWRRPDMRFIAAEEVHDPVVGVDAEDPRSGPHAYLEAPRAPDHETVVVRYQNPYNALYPDCQDWEELPWMAVLEFPTREQIEQQFGPTTADLLQWTTLGASSQSLVGPDRRDQGTDRMLRDTQPHDGESRARVWRIFDRTRKRVIFLEDQGGGNMDGDTGSDSDRTGPGWGEEDAPFHGVLAIVEDEFDFPDFFPFVRPFQTIESEESILPEPEYCQIRDQLDEVDALTERVRHFRQALVVCAITPTTNRDIVQRMFNDTDRPKVVSISTPMPQGAKMEDMLAYVPNEETVSVLTAMYRMREDVKAEVFEITGISDIMRGHGNASETARAQEIKLSSGSRRTKHRETVFNDMVKSTMRKMAHIICTRFDDETIVRIGGMEMRTQAQLIEELQQLQEKAPQAFQMAQQGDESAWQQIAKGFEKLKKQPTRERTLAILRDSFTRDYSIDIETNSTIMEMDKEGKEQSNQLMEAVTHATQALGPLTQVGVIPQEMFFELLKMVIRPFSGSRQLEMVLEQTDPDFSAFGMTEADKATMQQDAIRQAEQAKADASLEVERLRGENAKELEKIKGQQAVAKEQVTAGIERERMERETQLKTQELKAKIENDRQKVFMEIMKGQAQMRMQQQQNQQQMQMQQQQGQMDMAMQQEQHQQTMQQQEQQGNQQLQQQHMQGVQQQQQAQQAQQAQQQQQRMNLQQQQPMGDA